MDPNMMNAQMGQASFYYYTPDHNPENRQHGHFSQHPGFQQVQHQMYPIVPTLPSTPIYSRPNSSCSQVPTKIYAPVRSNLTPMTSPQRTNMVLHSQPGKLMLETDVCDTDSFYYPATPPLSTSGSSMGSPAHIQDILATPLNPMFSGLDGFELMKADEEAALQPLENLDWSSCGSPPLTPVYLQQLQAPRQGKSISLDTNVSSEHLSVNTNSSVTTPVCTSFSAASSPSPSPSSCDSQDIDFCDPRHLTVGGASNPTLSLDYAAPAPLPATYKGDNSSKDTAHPISFDFNPELPHGLPTFGDISDLESEDDFLNRLVNLSEQPSTEGKRSRSATCSTTLSLGHDSFLTEGDFDYEDATSCCATGVTVQSCSSDSDTHQDKKIKTTKETIIMMNVAADSPSQQGQQQETSSHTAAPSETANNASNPGAGADAHATPLPAPPNRRGRKQSLTEDPSKTFVCELCNRRFRRQEHLKRHYRSLHTHDKPFKCSECNKSFSRSDNLAQHARTHGSGAIVMDILDGSEESLDMMGSTPSDYKHFGSVLFQVASEIPGSSSDLSDDSQSEDDSNKKRKRSE